MDYTINGIGKINNHPRISSLKQAYLLNGYLAIDVSELKPDFNITMSLNGLTSYYDNYYEVYTNDFDIELPELLWTIGSDEAESYKNQFEGITSEAIQGMINFVYAIHGYTFGGKDFYYYFEKFIWYIPNPQLSKNDIEFNVKKQAFLTALIKDHSKR